MPYLSRALSPQLCAAARTFPALLLTGPRQCGKTTLLRHLFPKATYVLLEDPDVLARVRADPVGFLEALALPAIIDEVQNAPELFRYIRARIDAEPRRPGRWLLTGSQEAPLMRGVSESMAGRVAILQLLPLAVSESEKVTLLRGGFPSVVTRPSAADLWLRSYVQTYLERDLRAVTAVRDLATFRRFLALLATRVGTILNKTDLAAPLGISVPTVGEWLGALAITGVVLRVPPFYENFGKRLVKSPKVYFVDSGLACHLLGLESQAALRKSTFLGPIFEGFVAAELVKQQINSGHRVQLYYFRDQQGLEIDFILPRGARRLALIEAKATHTPLPGMAQGITKLRRSIRDYKTEGLVIHEAGARRSADGTLSPGVRALSLPAALEHLR